ncbi:MAG TPA: GvpL/GvpF family gas vesicle protein [Gemmatimonadaceae bacterium]
MTITGLRLFGVTSVARDTGSGPPLDAGVVRTRDLAALVRPAPYERHDPDAVEIDAYRGVIAAAFQRGVVLPAPCGTTFRNTEQLRRWMEQNYIALSEGIHFVAGRCEGRVHVEHPQQADGERSAAELSPTQLNDAFRQLRRVAAAVTTLAPATPRIVYSAAFLLDRERWNDFEPAVQALRRRHETLHIALTGPWPPYDFVRLDFGVLNNVLP